MSMAYASVRMEDEQLVHAAAKIAQADFLLIAAGAGFSADSGLPVYNDIANVAAYEQQGLDYQDLCDPHWLEEDPEVFYGFWGSCLNSYRDTVPHRGYDILRRWRDRVRDRAQATAIDERFLETRRRLELSGALPPTIHATGTSSTSAPFFVYTSNVDAHFHRHFEANEIYEVHGSVEDWQCAGVTREGKPQAQFCDGITWRVPSDMRVAVDAATMKAEPEMKTLLACRQCEQLGRPNVLMFHDKKWLANVADENGYVVWEAVVEQMLEEDPTLQLVVLEIGCGTRVPSVRKETEMVVADVFERCTLRRGSPSGQVSLVRVNPDPPGCDHPVLLTHGLVHHLQAGGLATLERIDALLSSATTTPAATPGSGMEGHAALPATT